MATAFGSRVDAPGSAASRDGTGPLAMTLIMLGFVAIWLAALFLAARLMMLPAEAAGRLYVAFPPGTGADQAYRAIVAAGGRPIGPALGSWSWEAYGDEAGFVGRLGERGALVAFRTTPLGVPLAGCLGTPERPSRLPLRRRRGPRSAPDRPDPGLFGRTGTRCRSCPPAPDHLHHDLGADAERA